MPTKTAPQNPMDVVRDPRIPLTDRASALMFAVVEGGSKVRPDVEKILHRADIGAAYDTEEGGQSFMSGRFISLFDDNGSTMAVVRNREDIYVGIPKCDAKKYKAGQHVLYNQTMVGTFIVGSDPNYVGPAQTATVQRLIKDEAGKCAMALTKSETGAEPPVSSILPEGVEVNEGDRVLVSHGVVIKVLDSAPNKRQELLADLSMLDLKPEEVGALNPVYDEIVFRLKMLVEHKDWADQMGARLNCSYMFSGATGCGKTLHIRLIAKYLTDYIEQKTGEAKSRLVLVDAARFYTMWFGETERKIAEFFDQLRELAAEPLIDKDGNKLAVPLLVVLEEAESLLRARSADNHNNVTDRAMSMLLARVSSLGSELDVPIMFICTSNRPDIIDAAARRRFGCRQVHFGSLDRDGCISVLKTKITETTPVFGGSRAQLISEVSDYLYDTNGDGVLAHVRTANQEMIPIRRNDIVTGAVLEEAVSQAVDECLRKSVDANELLGIDAKDVIKSIADRQRGIVDSLRPHNLREYVSHLVSQEPHEISGVTKVRS